jgi:hypothetical protein
LAGLIIIKLHSIAKRFACSAQFATLQRKGNVGAKYCNAATTTEIDVGFMASRPEG